MLMLADVAFNVLFACGLAHAAYWFWLRRYPKTHGPGEILKPGSIGEILKPGSIGTSTAGIVIAAVCTPAYVMPVV